MSRPTLADVARLAGVSIGTASRVINKRNVREETKRAVEDAVASCGMCQVPWHGTW